MNGMTIWPVQHAKARFSELLDACQREGPQVVSRRGTEAAVLVPIEQWHRLQAAARPSLKQLLLSPEARTGELVPPRGEARRRAVVEL
jgi:antitoxin Phd